MLLARKGARVIDLESHEEREDAIKLHFRQQFWRFLAICALFLAVAFMAHSALDAAESSRRLLELCRDFGG